MILEATLIVQCIILVLVLMTMFNGRKISQFIVTHERKMDERLTRLEGRVTEIEVTLLPILDIQVKKG